MVIEFILMLLAAYLLGSIPVAYIAARFHRGIDIRQYGSGQVGAGNLFRSVSKPLGLVVGIYDAGKGVLMVWLAHLIGLGFLYQIIIGIAVIAGHNWPVFLKFNAGRGMATTVGIAFYLLPQGIPIFIFFVLLSVVVGSTPVTTLLGMASFPVISWAFNQSLTLTLGLTALVILLIIRRLTAPRSAESTNISICNRLLYRFLFDRDTRVNKAWDKKPPVKSGVIGSNDKDRKNNL